MAAPTNNGAENSTTSTNSTTSSNYGNAPLSSSTADRSDVRGRLYPITTSNIFTFHYIEPEIIIKIMVGECSSSVTDSNILL